MSRRTSFTTLLNQAPATGAVSGEAEDKPALPPTTVLMHTITGNPENPRQPEDYTDDDPEFAELKETMRLVGQLQPVAAVSHDVYVRIKPEYAKAVKDAEYVVVGGNRRLAAARQLGWTRFDIRVQDRLGDEDGRLDDAVIIENIHRKKIDPIKEAEFLRRMVERHGSQDEVARRIGKSQMYVSHRLELLKLDDEVKHEIEAGSLKPSQARGLASKPAEEQRAQVAKIKESAQQPKPRKKPVQNGVLKTAQSTDDWPVDGQPQNGVLETAQHGGDSAEGGQLQNGVLKPEPDTTETHETQTAASESVPEPRQASADTGSGVRKFPYDDGKEAAFYLNRRMEDDQFFAMVDEVNQMAKLRREKAAKAS
ncbi:ParB/RepB/Spo0J family partition protein [Streptomyces sp. NPDC088348]|uniref:ParB/RepB/Spo0J family partition protein n=1 Tax=Streptomyces sp. NPDC088348 TaxID=3365853 RepID=UPI0038070A2A